jgi:hypothetical protein
VHRDHHASSLVQAETNFATQSTLRGRHPSTARYILGFSYCSIFVKNFNLFHHADRETNVPMFGHPFNVDPRRIPSKSMPTVIRDTASSEQSIDWFLVTKFLERTA